MERLGEKISILLQFVKFMVSEFFRHDCPKSAASLTFTTLLSLVPLMTVVLAVFAAFPISATVSDQLQNFVFNNFVPEAGEMVAEHFTRFSSNASKLTGVGFIFLLIVAMMLMMTIHQTFRVIWDSHSHRSIMANFLMYWAVLTIGPVLIGVSVVMSSYLFSLPMFTDPSDWSVGKQLLKIVPMLAAWLAFAMFYMIIPNQRVPILHAVTGGLVAALLFDLAKRLFGLYVSFFPTYQAIYGALAAIPIFLIWIYLSWMVTLLGAELTRCLTVFQKRQHTDSTAQSSMGFVETIDVMVLLMRAQNQGNILSFSELSLKLPTLDDYLLTQILRQLSDKQWVVESSTHHWVVAKNLNNVTLKQLYLDLQLPFPVARDKINTYPVIGSTDHQILSSLDVPLSHLMNEEIATKASLSV